MPAFAEEPVIIPSGLSTPYLAAGSADGASTPGTDLSDFTSANDVAVIGMGCRLAGGNNSPEDLWQAILNKTDASGDIPSMRWEPYLRRDIRNAKVLERTTRRGYFLDNLEDFDAAFFGISPKEAEQMDPQQRLSLEVAWEALENAGIPPQSLSGSDTAVFMGVNSDDYSKLLLEDLPRVEAWMGIGTAYCGVPNRISYHLNLMGPSTAVDAACASSLVAIHHGRQAILQGESKVAITGGVNALCGPGLTSVLDKAGATTPEGCCRSFDDSANGYGRGEGAAVVILKDMTAAIHDGDNILAVLKGSAVAQDGRTNGIMAPNAKAQELVANNALSFAGIDPSTIGYVEAHATSTPLGDPTEVSAISAVYGKGRPIDKPCYIGSVKPNVGHLEAGAGAVGFIKAVMSVQKGVLPPQANLKKLNSRIDWDKAGVRVVQEARPWPYTNSIRRAGTCSYGYGGTVSHAVIEEYTKPNQSIPDGLPGPYILLLSAPQEKRLVTQADTQASWISKAGRNQSMRSISTTLATRRGHHDYRAAFVVDSHDDAGEKLAAFAKGNPVEFSTSNRVLGNDSSKSVVWVFSGHGAQWPEMAKDLIHEPVFCDVISSLEPIVQAEMGFSALEALKTGDFDASDKVQVLTYLMQVGLNAVLRSKGLKPDAVIGHSVGEIAASVAAGSITPKEGALIVTKRANLYRRVMGLGAMILVNLPFADMQKELEGNADLGAAIDSSPSSCVVSGTKKEVESFAESLKERGVKSFRVKTDIAFHHPMLDVLSEPLAHALDGIISPGQPEVTLYSTSAEDPRSIALRDIPYWTNNMVNPVRLTSAVSAAVDDGMRLFLEVSSHPVVTHSIKETLMDEGIEDFTVANTMLRHKPADKTILHSISQLHCHGATVDWKKQMNGAWATDVPITTWSHKPIWRQVETGPLSVGTTHDVDKHTLLGQRVTLAGENMILYTTKIDDSTKPFPGSHPLHGSEIVPAAALVNTFLHGTGARSLHNITLRVPVAISQLRDIQVIVQPGQVRICSRLVQHESSDSDDGSWLTHTTGHWTETQDAGPVPPEKIDIEAVRSRIGTKLADKFSIDYLDKVGVSAMGFPWAVTEHHGNLREMIARVDVAPDVKSDTPLPWDPHSWAPILDAATSIGSTIFFDQPRLRMPAHIERVDVYTQHPPPKIGYLYVEEATNTDLAVHVTVCDELGNAIAKIESMRFAEIEGSPGISGSVGSLVHQLAWPPASYSETPLPIQNVILISNDIELAEQYGDSVKEKLKSVTILTRPEELIHLSQSANNVLAEKDTMVAYIPGRHVTFDSIPTASHEFIFDLLNTVKFIVNSSLPAKVFVLTDAVAISATPASLAQSPLHGLSRIIASEHPETWGALIDTEVPHFPLEVMKYVQEVDNVRVSDGIPRVARLRPLPRDRVLPPAQRDALLPKPGGTYLITGGFGALGLEVADFLVEQGARRLILVSRRQLPPRSQWQAAVTESTPLAATLQKIQLLESRGATIHALAVDIGSPSGASQLSEGIESLSLPPVLGVVHAAGVLEDQLVMATTQPSFQRVLAPKISGALALNAMFPPKALDFMMLFSSCGQLFGFPGQASYASGNSFLDALATNRRRQGDNTIAMQWTSWRGMGMAASTDFINAELATKGITDVTRDEAFRAWLQVSKYDIDHATILRSLAFEADEQLPSTLLTDIAIRKTATGPSSATANETSSSAPGAIPESGPERRAYFDERIRECVARVLQFGSSDEVDSKAPLSDLGVDSVMTVTLRGQLQKNLGVKVPPTLTWSCPTVSHLTKWYMEKVK